MDNTYQPVGGDMGILGGISQPITGCSSPSNNDYNNTTGYKVK
jgi:hypothetical protein